MFVYKNTETIECFYFSRKVQTSRVNNSRILGFKNAKFQDSFHVVTSILGDQICISAPLILSRAYREIFKSALVYL